MRKTKSLIRKARLMFLLLALLTIASGASALSAKKKYGNVIYKATIKGTAATIIVDNYTLIFISGAGTTIGYFTTVYSAVVNFTVTAYFQI